MREIKFRAWVNIEEWQGYYYPKTKPNDYIQFVLYQDGWGVLDCNDQWLNKDEFIIEQYTGLKDKNGKEIYEGDIIHHERCVEGNDCDGSYDVYLKREGRITITASTGVTLNGWFKTEYDNGHEPGLNKHWSGYCSHMDRYGEIIGNIHEGTYKQNGQ